jgi:hypothetical protein
MRPPSADGYVIKLKCCSFHCGNALSGGRQLPASHSASSTGVQRLHSSLRVRRQEALLAFRRSFRSSGFCSVQCCTASAVLTGVVLKQIAMVIASR